MIETLQSLDRQALLYINSHHSSVADQVMIFLSAKLVWIPLYAIIIAYLWWQFRRHVIVLIIFIALLITAADQVASSLIKPVAARLRPCHDTKIASQLYLAKGCGGTYGFVSSHAANTFAIACFLSLLIKVPIFSIAIYSWAALVSYSRIYLGAHYPGDVIGGAVCGIILAVVIYKVYDRYKNNLLPYQRSA